MVKQPKYSWCLINDRMIVVLEQGITSGQHYHVCTVRSETQARNLVKKLNKLEDLDDKEA